MQVCARMTFFRFILFTCICCQATKSLAQDAVIYNNTTTAAYIQTVRLQRTDLALVQPVILLNSADKLELTWDDLRPSTAYYTYTFTHCNHDWRQSGLNAFDVLDGFEQNNVQDYALSFSTYQTYTHYNITFPNEDINFKVSGNYVIQVWEEDNDTVPVITRRFYVWEDEAAVTGSVLRPNMVEYRNAYQEVNFTVDVKNLDVTNPYDEIRVAVMQNNRPDNARYNLKPRFINNNVLHFDNDDIVFLAGKEYRRFDTNTLRFQTERIVKIEKGYKRYDVYVNIDESRAYKQYFYEKDINGNFVIDADLTQNAVTEADYAYIHFTLQYPYYQGNGAMHVVGDFNDYQTSEENKMQYDFDKNQYTATLFLKQGYYNYLYIYTDSANPDFLDLSYAEGNHFEAENDYSIFVYQHSYDRDHDRLIGYTKLNTYNK
jgi:hypothetical protein